MFRRIETLAAAEVEIIAEGRPIRAPEGANLAAVLLHAGFSPFRTTPLSGAGRAAYCMMGVCFDCLVAVDGRPNRQSCLETVRAGMVVERQAGAAGIIGQ